MKKLFFMFFAAALIMQSCTPTENNPPPPSDPLSTFTIGTDGTYEVPDGWFTTVTNATNLQFAFIGTRNSVNNGGNIYFPLGATTGTYNVVDNYPNHGTGLAANEVAVDMASGPNHDVNIAQSGTVSLTVNGGNYKIVFTDLPSLTDGTSLPDVISANLEN